VNGPGAGHSLERRLASGMRWTLWTGIVGVPFSYATNVLLARVGPETIGTYGVLGIYAGAVATFFYLGGNAVTVKFMAECEPSRRMSFLVSYFAVMCIALIPVFFLTSLRPDLLEYLFGRAGGQRMQLLMVWLAPVYLLFLLVLSTLKGLLDLAVAQLLTRMVPILSFCCYLLLFLARPMWLSRYSAEIIWGLFLALTGAALAIAALRLRALQRPIAVLRLGFYLPPGFWKYATGVQLSSWIGFFSTYADSLLIVNRGGIDLLGRYVTLMTMVLAIGLLPTFLLESFVPSLMNCFARDNEAEASTISERYLRIIAPLVLGATVFESVLAGPLMQVFGRDYSDLTSPLVLVAPAGGLYALSGFFGTILVVRGLARYEAGTRALRILVFVAIFQGLWDRYGIFGAAAAWAIAEFVYHVVVLNLACFGSGYRFPVFRTYVWFFLGVSVCPLLGNAVFAAPVIPRLAGAVAVLVGFAWLAGYSKSEIRHIARSIVKLPQRNGA
jgi:O-antigen/teichoic acid export membrane protein